MINVGIDAQKPNLDDRLKGLIEDVADGYVQKMAGGEKIGLDTILKTCSVP